jgi:aquaporin Z
MEHWKKYAAEAYGTFVLVGIGSGALLAALLGGGGVVNVAFGFGLALTVALFTVGRVSSGYFNPVVSLAMYLDKRLSVTDLAAYWASQLAGAVLASLTLAWVISREAVANTVTAVNQAVVTDFSAFVIEAVLTAVFVLVILVVSKSESDTKFFVIGLALVGVHLAGVPLTGASVNPARSLAPALVGGEWQNIGVYIAGPVVGAVIAWVIYTGLFAGAADGDD